MDLEAQIKKDEEELEALAATEEAEDQNEDTSSEDNDSDENDAENDGDESDGDKDDEDADDTDNEDAGDSEGGDEEEKTAEDDKDTDAGADKDDEEDEKTASIRLRIEQKKSKALEERLAALEAAQNKPPETPPTGDEDAGEEQLTTEERLDRMEQEKQAIELRNNAIQEFNEIEKEFLTETPDYDPASTHMINNMVMGVMYANPNVSEAQAVAVAQNQVLQIAAQAAQKGLNPAETLYNMAFERYGYKPSAESKKQSTQEKAEKLKKVSKNKKRSASSLAGGGQSGSATVTSEEASKMDIGTFSNLSEAEIDQMIADAS